MTAAIVGYALLVGFCVLCAGLTIASLCAKDEACKPEDKNERDEP